MSNIDHLRAMENLESLNDFTQTYSVFGKTDHERAMNILSNLEKSDIFENREITTK